MTRPGPRVPLALRLAVRFLPRDVREEVLGDLLECWHDHVRTRSRSAAFLWAWRQPVHTAAAGLRERGRRPPRRGRSGIGASWLDVKLAGRMLVKHPGLTVVALFALAIGIPVGLLPLHVLDALTAPLPVEAGDRIVMVRNYDATSQSAHQRPLHDFRQWREELSSFELLGVWRTDLFNVASDDRATPVRGAEVTASIFDILDVPPHLGRRLDAADEIDGAADVVVIGYDLWHSRMAGDPEVVGRTIRLGGVPHTVVGVMPEGFLFPVRDHLWLPLRAGPGAYEWGQGPEASVVGRLGEGVSVEDARSEIERMGLRMADRLPETHARLRPQILSYTEVLTGMDAPEAGAIVLVTQTLALLLLALACGNVGLLTLARTATRSGELAVRTALGASRTRLVSQLFVESLLLAGVAAGLGLFALHLVVGRLDSLSADLPFWVDLGVSIETAALAVSLAVASAAIAGIVPALNATGTAVHASMQRASGGGSGIRFGKGYSALIMGEVAVALWLLTLGSALLPSAASVAGPVGVEADEYLHAALRIPGASVQQAGLTDGARRVAEAHTELVRRSREEPGIGSFAIADALPGMSHPVRYVQVEGMPRKPDAPAPAHLVSVARVDMGYFQAMEHPILSGRGFGPRDLEDDRSAVIVNQAFVDGVLEGRNPLGRRLRYWVPEQEPGDWAFEIVGVVGPLGVNVVNPEKGHALYHAVRPGELHPIRFAARVGDEPERFTPRLRTLAAEIDAGALIENPVSLDRVPNPDRRVLVLWTSVVGFLAAIAIMLSGACLYALMSFTVTERTRESAIRTALGGRSVDILSTIMRRALYQLSWGVAIGGLLSAGVLWALNDNVINSGALHTSRWPLTVVALAMFMIVVGLLACVKPALRALRIQPVAVLKG